MRILLTAFEPFGGDAENASQQAVQRLEQAWAADPQSGVELVTGTLPVAFGTAGEALRSLVDEHEPDAVLAIGEAGGRAAITPERWGVNEDDARIPDAAGAQPRGTAIDAYGPARRASGFDVDALVGAILAVGLPAEPSDNAGRYLCNHIAYLAGGLDVPGGFIHVPALRTSGTATVGAETDADASPGASALTHDGWALTFDHLALALAAAVRAIAHGDALLQPAAPVREAGERGRGEPESRPGEQSRREPDDRGTEARVDRAGTVIRALPQQVYRALLDPDALAAWLPPEGATGTVEAMDAREGGGFRLVLRFADPSDTKTTETTDASQVTFVELVPGALVVQRVAFDSVEERFRGDMVMTWRLERVGEGTRVTVAATDVPAGIAQADHELGLGSSLANLARYLEAR